MKSSGANVKPGVTAEERKVKMDHGACESSREGE